MQKYSDGEDTDNKPVKRLVIAGALFQQNSIVNASYIVNVIQGKKNEKENTC